MQNHFLIGEKYIDWFNDTGIKLIEKSKLKSFTLERLKKNMERQSELGFEAEKFVLEYELRMRNKHPTCSKIRIISEEDVSAGYDIESYIDDKSIVLDSKKIHNTKNISAITVEDVLQAAKLHLNFSY